MIIHPPRPQQRLIGTRRQTVSHPNNLAARTVVTTARHSIPDGHKDFIPGYALAKLATSFKAFLALSGREKRPACLGSCLDDDPITPTIFRNALP
jgi:hypothetical protein